MKPRQEFRPSKISHRLIGLFLILIFLISCTSKKKYEIKTQVDPNGYKYETVSNDPLKARIYTLDNGLKVYLSQNTDEPRIATLIGVRAGSTSDPVETTGLAHYFEHMMFKGTDKIGALNWEEEKEYLDLITELFEQHKAAKDPEEKLAIYKQIDSVSQIAATFVAANEYDKMISGLGAKSTNAGTSYDQTLFINDIPSNELEKWLEVESERFQHMVLRLFHTELEAVYEEYNMYQDMDYSRANKAMMKGLFPNHPYGRDIIGLPEHIKNPSIKNIYQFAKTWYVPNNMAITLSGDIDFEKTISMIDTYFGSMKPNENLPKVNKIKEEPIQEPVIKEVIGPDAESLTMAFRFDGDNSPDLKYVTLIDMLLNNSKAGLIDLNLNQQQKVLQAGSGSWFLRDYGLHQLYGKPREGQSLEELKDLLLEQIELIKSGDFDNWMIEAVINDLRLSEIRSQESNFSRVYGFIDMFVKNIPYTDRLRFLDELEKITKEEIVEFAKTHYKDNYVVVYKRTGENKSLTKVEKPPITPIEINRDEQSEYYKKFQEEKPESLKPVFVDFKNDIQTGKLSSGVEINYIKNETNELFNLQYIIDMGKNHDLELPLAVNYLPYLGTDKYSAEELQKEFFKYGLSMRVNAGATRSYISISGLEKSFEKGVELLEHVLANVQPDADAYSDYIDGILKKRSDAKLNKSRIMWGGLYNYGKYGPFNPQTNIIAEDELRLIDPNDLTDLLKGLYSYEHRMFYYGMDDFAPVKKVIGKYHKIPDELKPYPPEVQYTEQANEDAPVYFVDYDMSQVNLLLLAKGPGFEKELIPPSKLFGEYFGTGFSSIVFQEIRESRALAYSAFSAFAIPAKKEQSFFVYGFVGTQADKLEDATDAMLGLMNNMPRSQRSFDLAREASMKEIETERIIKTRKFWTYQSNLDKGIDYDIRKDVYDYMKSVTMDEFSGFFDEYIKGNKYTILVIGDRKKIDMKALGTLGEVKELSLRQIFNY